MTSNEPAEENRLGVRPEDQGRLKGEGAKQQKSGEAGGTFMLYGSAEVTIREQVGVQSCTKTIRMGRGRDRGD